jgi:2'-5' RNA ligase
MYAIASMLDPNADVLVRRLWTRFESHCGLTGIRLTPLPHFSWQGAQEYQLEHVETILNRAAVQISPFVVRTAGLGIFTGRQPVVYIALVKDERLLNIHKMLWEQIWPYAALPNIYYDPSQWIPHITLANYDLDPGALGCAVETTAFEEIGFEILVQDFSILFRTDGAAGLQSSFRFRDRVY